MEKVWETSGGGGDVKIGNRRDKIGEEGKEGKHPRRDGST